MVQPSQQTGFSLVELAIVLVILGLLTGGIIAGQSLIRASQLRAVTTEEKRWITAIHAFRGKYLAFPGDFRDGTRFWGRMNGNSDCVTNSGAAVAADGSCDGDGNGEMKNSPSIGASGEMHQLWRQLALAGLIEGTYSGVSGPGGASNSVLAPEPNVPASRVPGAGWATSYLMPRIGDSFYFDGIYGNTLFFGKPHNSAQMVTEVLTPSEAWNIDTKMDDGQPAQGKLVARVQNDKCAVKSDGTTLATSSDLDALYNLTSNIVTCALYFRQAY